MYRREILQKMVLGGAIAGLPSINSVPSLVIDRDQYGGWTGRKFKATGFFRVEKDNRWWIVTPEGNAFLSFGINHLYPDLWKQEFNREMWQEKLGVEIVKCGRKSLV